MSITEIQKTLSNYFNPILKHDSDLAEGTCSSCIVTGVSLVVASLTAPAIVSGNALIRNSVSLMGMSFITAGVTKKKGFVFLPGIVALSFAGYLKSLEAHSYLRDLYKRDIRPILFNKPLENPS